MSATQTPIMIELGDAGEHNPYHFFFYMLGRFKFVDDGTNTILYHYPNKKNCYFSEAALSALPERFKREKEKREGVVYREIRPLRCYVDYIEDNWVYSYVRDLYKHIWENIKQIKGKYTYISRAKSGSKASRALNEERYLEDLKKLGFSIYHMEDLSFDEQIRLFRSSEIICGPHGAAFSFGMFCEPGTILCETFPAKPGKGHFADLSKHCDLKFFRYPHILYHHEESNDMIVKPAQYIESIKELIALSKKGN